MNTRKKLIKTVYKDEDDSDCGGDFSDSGSDASISEHSGSSDEPLHSEAEDVSDEEIILPPKKVYKQIKKIPVVRTEKFAKSFISKIRPNAEDSDEDNDVGGPVFSVKDLSEADKLLPSVLNLSDSDSSDDESPKASTSHNITSTSSQKYDSDSEVETKTEYTDVFSKNLPDNSEEIAKKTFLELEKHKNKLEETKASIEKYCTAQNNAMEVDVKDLLAQGEEVLPEPVPLKKPSKSRRKRDDSDSEMEDWEEVKERKEIPQQGIQFIVDLPNNHRKSKKLDVEMMMKRKLNRVKKQYQVYMHKVHVLCWLGHGNYVSRTLNEPEILAAVLSLIPSEKCYPGERIVMSYVEQITNWYKDKLTLKQDKNEDKFRPKAPPLKDLLLSQIKNKVVTSKKYLVYIFVCMLRAIGVQCRIMFNFVTLPLKPPASELCSLSMKPKDKVENDKTKTNTSAKKTGSTQKNKKTKPKSAISQVDGQDDMSYSEDDDENIIQLDGNNDPPAKTRSTRSKTLKNSTENENDDVSPPKRSKLSTKNEQSNLKTRSNAKKNKPKTCDAINKSKRNSVASASLESLNIVDELQKCSPSKSISVLDVLNEKIAADRLVKSPKKKLQSIPAISITDTDKSEVSSKYFEEKATSSSFKRLSLSRKRSQTVNPTQTQNTNVLSKKTAEDSKTKSRTKSAPGTSVKTSKYFDDSIKSAKNIAPRKRKDKDDILEDAQRVSHKQLHRKPKSKNDVTGDLVNIIKSRVKEAKTKAKQGVIKGKTKEESDDSDFLPEEDTTRDHESDDEFKPCKISPKPFVKRKIDRRVLSSEEIEPKRGQDVWCEVYVEELDRWFSIDVIKAKVHCPEEIYKQATHPVNYIVGWDNNNNLKDLTRRYVPRWNTITRKQRVEPDWMQTALKPWRGPNTLRDREEDKELDQMQLEAPLPKTITEYKNHPLYALSRHLLKYEAIYPPDSATLGFVRNEPVYSRDCVYVCRSRDTWLKEAKVVKLGEKPYKIVKARPKWDKLSNRCINDIPLEIFGPWQIKDYEPPTAENGIVPRNAYGNVELFKACMLPKGTVHMKLPGLNRVAKKLNVDCAPAMTGFDFNGGFTHPVYDGYVVCKEVEEVLTEAWLLDQEEQERKETEKLETRVYGNWKRLIKGLLIRERLKLKYGFEEPGPSKDDKKKSKGPKLVVKKRG